MITVTNLILERDQNSKRVFFLLVCVPWSLSILQNVTLLRFLFRAMKAKRRICKGLV